MSCGIDQGEEYQMDKDMNQHIKKAFHSYQELIKMNLSPEDREFDDVNYFIRSFAQHVEAQLTGLQSMKCAIGHTIPPIECQGECAECYNDP